MTSIISLNTCSIIHVVHACTCEYTCYRLIAIISESCSREFLYHHIVLFVLSLNTFSDSTLSPDGSFTVCLCSAFSLTP